MSRARGTQLALRFPLSARCHFESFVPGANAELVRRLEDLDAGERGFRGYLLFGEAGVGKSHLLQAACHRHGAGGAMYLPLTEVAPAMLEGLETRYLVALDDVDAWLGDAAAERALLALYQGLLERRGRLLVSAAGPPGGLTCHFADLASRLGGLAAYRVHALADADKADVLQRLARERGLALPRPVLDFWLARGSRDMAVLLDQLEALDEAAMAAQRRLTVPLVKDVLGL